MLAVAEGRIVARQAQQLVMFAFGVADSRIQVGALGGGVAVAQYIHGRIGVLAGREVALIDVVHRAGDGDIRLRLVSHASPQGIAFYISRGSLAGHRLVSTATRPELE